MRLLLVLVFASGFSALVYQILWLRLLGLVFGVTVHAATTVVAAFMAGLALGSLAGGRLSRRVRTPGRWFGAAELLIGATALTTPLLLAGLEQVYVALHAWIAGDPRVLTPVRFVASLAVLLVPTTLMGATFPLALRIAARGGEDAGRRAAALYASNTSGAVVGALVTGYYLVADLGIQASFLLAAGLNALVGLIAIRWLPTVQAAGGAGEDTTVSTGGSGTSVFDRRLVLAMAAVNGFVGLALEIVWFRALVMFLPATTYVFTTILAVVLGGIAAGSAIATRLLRSNATSLRRLAFLQVGIAVAAAGSLAAQGWSYAHGWRTGATLQAAALSILPTMLMMGAAFPIALSCWTDGVASSRAVAERTGRFYLTNLVGAIAGAIAAGFLLIPWLGTRGALVSIAGLSLVAGVRLLARVERRPVRLAVVGVGAAGLFIAAAVLLPDPLDVVLERRFGGERVLWREEGAQATVSVHAGERRVMYLDGLHQANDSPEMVALHRQIGALAMALHPQARQALVIGLGGGVTAGAVATFSQAQTDVVELTPAMVRAARWFAHVNGNVLDRSNVRVRIDDGRNHLLVAGRQYDVITADIIQPFHAGAGNLYSLEYFELARARLRDGGLMLQWIGHPSETQYKLIARTFLEAFPHVTAWAGGTLLVGTTQPLRLSRAEYARRLADPAFANGVRGAGIHEFSDLLRLYTAGADALRRFVGPGPVLTDDRPLVEYFLALPRDDRPVSLTGVTGDVMRHVTP